MNPRKIIHVDMDAFFAAVEQRDTPAYRGKPLIVGGQPDSQGVVAACSYEARRFGIHSAMPCSRAYRLCPEAIFVSPRFEAYRLVSQQIRAIFYEFSDDVEPLSLDEAYLDVTGRKAYDGSATLMAAEIKHRIYAVTGLKASAGVSYNKFLAKIASDMDKPDGLYVIRPQEGEAFVAELPIGQFFGVGKVTEAKMQALGVFKGSDLKTMSLARLQRNFGKSAAYYHQICRGIDHRPVASRQGRKSLGKETTFSTDLCDAEEMLGVLEALAVRVGNGLKLQALQARTLTIKVKYANFQQVTRSVSRGTSFTCVEDMLPFLPCLLSKTEVQSRSVRLLGVSLAGFEPEDKGALIQLDLFSQEER